MDCWVTFKDVQELRWQLTGSHLSIRGAGFLDMWNKFIVDMHTDLSGSWGGSVVVKLSLDPRVQPVRNLDRNGLEIIQ
jgi:hypothetical protein